MREGVKERSNCYGIVITLSSDYDDVSTARFPSRSHSTLRWRVNLETVFCGRWSRLFGSKGKMTDNEDSLVRSINWCRCLGTCPTCLIYIDWNRPAMKNRQEAIVLDRVFQM